MLHIHIIVTSQECTDTVGSLSHDDNIVDADQTFILDDHAVPCSATVIAWEFCYRILNVSSVTFYPGIWNITGASGGSIDYALVQSNTVTYDSTIRDPQDPNNNCQIFNLSDTDQFNAPAGSVVGLYSNTGTVRALLLRTNTDNLVTTYQFKENQSSIYTTGRREDVNYNIAIRVHLGQCTHLIMHKYTDKNNNNVTTG